MGYAGELKALAAWIRENTNPEDMLNPQDVPVQHRFAITMAFVETGFERMLRL